MKCYCRIGLCERPFVPALRQEDMRTSTRSTIIQTTQTSGPQETMEVHMQPHADLGERNRTEFGAVSESAGWQASALG